MSAAPSRLPELTGVLAVLSAEADDDAQGRPSSSVLAALHTSGVLGLPVPVEFGGLGGGWAEANAVVAALSRVDASVGIIVFLHYAAISRIIGWGTRDQQKRLLVPVTGSGRICGSSWSEPGADAAKQRIATTAHRRPDGGWELNGAKSFTTSAGVADLYLVLARTGEAEGASGSYGQTNQSIFVIDAEQLGFTVDGTLDLAGMRRSATGLIRLDAVRAGSDDLLAESADTPSVIGHPHTLGLTLGAVALGVAQSARDLGMAAARQRSLLESPLHRYHLFETDGRLAAVRGVVEAATHADGDRTEAALTAKVFASETAEAVCRSAQEMAGSAAFTRSHTLNRLAQDARAVTLMGPPNHLCRELVAGRWGQK